MKGHDTPETIAYRKAKRKVEARFGFFVHLLIYILVNTFLITMNLIRSDDVIWSIWPLAGWGIGLLFHGLAVFVFSGMDQVKERMIQKEMAKHQ